jgi:aminoglycoside 6'-N-acetyltransferase
MRDRRDREATPDSASAAALLRGARVTLRPVTDTDRPRLDAILDEPAVARWWRRDEWRRVVTPDAVTFAIEDGGEVVGMIQYEEELDPDYRQASIDLFLTESRHGQGLGRDSIRTLARYLFAERGHHRLTMDPVVENERAVRCYTAVGFRPVGVMRQYERVADGIYRDAWLMELVADDLEG